MAEAQDNQTYLVVPTEGGWAGTAASGVRTLYELLCDVETLEVPGSPIVEQTCDIQL